MNNTDQTIRTIIELFREKSSLNTPTVQALGNPNIAFGTVSSVLSRLCRIGILEQAAREMAQEHNRTHDAGFLSRKAEFEEN